MEPAWGASWAWGLSLIALTIMAHALGVVVIALALVRLEGRAMPQRHSRRRAVLLAGAVFGVVGLALAMLHGAEAALWAFAYLGVGAIDSYREAILYSVDCMTTRGAVGMQLETRWQLMGALEAADGMLLFGVSTAFLFAVLQQVLPLISRRAATRRP